MSVRLVVFTDLSKSSWAVPARPLTGHLPFLPVCHPTMSYTGLLVALGATDVQMDMPLL